MAYNWNNYNRPKKKKQNNRPDHQPGKRQAYEHNRKRVLATQERCALCGQLVNKKLKYPDPYSPTIDHIIPVSQGGHPSDINNLQLAHFICNVRKGDKVRKELQAEQRKTRAAGDEDISNRVLPWAIDWTKYRAPESGSE